MGRETVRMYATGLATAAWLTMMRVVRGDRLRQFGQCQTLFVGCVFRDHVRRDFACRMMMALSATRRTTLNRALLLAAGRLSMILSALATGALPMVFADSFDRLRQFTLLQFAVLVRVKSFHQKGRELGWIRALMMPPLPMPHCTAETAAGRTSSDRC